MKTIKSIALALTLLTGTLVSANTEPVDPTKPVSIEIGQLLDNPQFEVEEDISAYVSFMLNDENEIVVLNVKTDNEQVERFVKSRLNYNTLAAKLEQGKQYNVSVRITTES